MLEAGGSLKLLDLGVVRLPGMEDFPPEATPGTAAYMAPEMFTGEAGNVATDIYALGVTLFRAFTGEYPYGNADAVSPPRWSGRKTLRYCGPIYRHGCKRHLAAPSRTSPSNGLRTWRSWHTNLRSGPRRTRLRNRDVS